MGSINRAIAIDVIKGKYPEEHTTKIVTYKNMFNNGLAYATVHAREYQNRYEESPACRDVEIVWTKHGGLTFCGRSLLGDI